MDNKAFENYIKQKGWDTKYRQSKQSATENWIEHRMKMREEILKRKQEEQEAKALEEYVEKKLEKVVEKEFEKLFKGLLK